MNTYRWFGYRPDYADLCRLYTTRELQLWYA
ncbi:MAG: Z1 domain-containing protein, partial [Steroidobacteraceae bacterium]